MSTWPGTSPQVFFLGHPGNWMVIDRHLGSLCCALSLCRFQFLETPRTLPARLLCTWDSPGKNTAVGGRVLLQGIFPTLGSWTIIYRHLGNWVILSMLLGSWAVTYRPWGSLVNWKTGETRTEGKKIRLTFFSYWVISNMKKNYCGVI